MHYWIKNYITKICNKNLIMDKIIPGKNQEVIRKIYEFSIKKGYLSQEMYDLGFDIQDDNQIYSEHFLLKNKKLN